MPPRFGYTSTCVVCKILVARLFLDMIDGDGKQPGRGSGNIVAKKRLLVIEDDTDVAEMLIIYFSGQGYEIIHAMTGNEGIALARAKFPI